jgi:DNA-directed RNA polymerase subunit E'/Rpb7
MNYVALFEEQIALTPKDLSQNIDSIDALLKDKLQKKLEGKCSRNGFVIPGKINVLSRSMGTMERGRFTGSILFHIQAEAEVLNPPEGATLEGVVIRKNKMGMYVSYSVNDAKKEDAIRVIIPRDLHIGDENFEKIEIGERVKVQIKKSRFQINDPYILSVGVLLGSVSGPVAPPPLPAPEPEEAGIAVAEAEAEAAPAEEAEAEEADAEEAVDEDEDEAVFDEEEQPVLQAQEE